MGCGETLDSSNLNPALLIGMHLVREDTIENHGEDPSVSTSWIEVVLVFVAQQFI